MNTLFEASGFQVEITKDGSPTLKQLTIDESMHHSSGAAAETWYIYGSVIKTVIETVFKQTVAKSDHRCIEICNVGLGLGYIEMVWAILADDKNTTLDSFEIVPELQTSLLDWILKNNSLTSDLYNDVAASLISGCPINLTTPARDIQMLLQQQIESSKLTFYGDVIQFDQNKKWNIICFDAFSKKTSTDLWSPEFLNQFLDQHAASDCVFTTYAATKSLKEALQLHGFTAINRPGFSSKRDSTLAVRGQAMIHAFQTF